MEKMSSSLLSRSLNSLKHSQMKKICLFFLISCLGVVNLNFANAADETTVEELITNEFVGGGTAQGWNGDDDEWDYTLPFSFNFYGVDYTDIKIGSNGHICLDNTKDCTWYPDPLSDSYPGPNIVPLGIDLQTDVNPSNDIYITENADNVVIRWDAVEFGETDQINFEAVLFDNGNIKFNYGDFDVDLTYEAIVGIAKGDGIVYTTSAYDNTLSFNQAQTSAWGEFGMEIDFSPRDEKFIVPLDSNLQMTFDRDIYKGSGNIILKKASDDSVIEVIDVDSVNITGWGTDTITINPTDDFDYFTEYYVNIDGTAFKDISDEYYAGITDNLTWNFTTDSLTEVIESIPTNECYEVGSAEASQPANTDLAYSDDDESTWVYTPVADGSGNDCDVTNIKLTYLNITQNLGEDLEAEFIGTTTDTEVISDGNGKVVLATDRIGTYTMGSANAEGSANADTAWGVTTDSNGYIYQSGSFKGTVDFDPSEDSEANFTPSGATALYLNKLSPDGNYVWTRVINTDQYSTYNGNRVDTDAAGNVYMTGHFIGSVDFNDPGAGDVKNSTGASDMFIVKYDSNGVYQWTKTIGGTGSVEIIHDMVVNDAGDTFITGYFYGTVDFDDTAGVDNHTANSGGASVFVAKYNADGSYGWTRTATGTAATLNEGIGLDIDSSDNVYLTGYFKGTIDLDGTAGVDNYTTVSSPGSDIFITKYNSDGSYGWSRTFGSSDTNYEHGRGITVNDSGEVFVSGIFHGTVDFDGTAGVDNITATNTSDIYLTKYNDDGSYEWTIKGSGFGSGWWGTDIEWYSDGVIMVEENTGAITRYDGLGDVVWSRSASSNIQGRNIAIYGTNVYTAGGFNSSTNFHTTGGTENHDTNGNTDIYITKHNVSGDYGFFFEGYALSGTYKTQITSQGPIVEWDAFSAWVDGSEEALSMSFKILDSSCTTTFLSGGNISDLSGIDVSNKELCMEVTFNTSDDRYSNVLDYWTASYTEKSSNTDTTITFASHSANLTATLALAGTQVNPTDTNEGNFVITFDQAIDGTSLTADDFSITGTMTISNIAEISPFDGTTFAITGTDMVANATVSIELPVNKVQTSGGTLNNVSNSVSLTYNTDPTPVLALAPGQANPTDVGEGNFVVTFDEPINGVTLTQSDFDITGDITLQGDPVEITPFDGTTFAFSGSGMVANQTVILMLPAGTVEDLAGNDNYVSNQISLTYNTDPTPVLALASAQANPTDFGEGNFVVTFDEPINGATLTQGDFDITGVITLQGDPVEITPFDGTTFTFSGSGMVANSTVTLVLPANTVEDLAGNDNKVSNQISLTYNTDPAPVLALALGQANPTDVGEGNFVVTFDEPIYVPTLTKDDFDITGALTLQGDPVEMSPFDGTTFAFSGSGMVANTTVILVLPAGTVEDLVGSLNVESNEISLTYDTDPTPVLSLAAGQNNPTNAGEGNFVVTFDESIDGGTLTKDDFDITGPMTLQSDPVEMSPFDGTTFAFSGSGMVANTTVTLVLPAGTVEDLTGNFNLLSNEVYLTYIPDDTEALVPVLIDTSEENPAEVEENEGTFTIMFNEPINVSTFSIDDFVVTGTMFLQGEPVEVTPFDGTTFVFSGSGMVAGETVIVSLPANRVFDLNGNGNVESNVLYLTYNNGSSGSGTVLQPTLLLAPGQKNPTFENSGEFRINFNKPINPATLTKNDLAITGTIIIQGNPVEIVPFDGTAFMFSGSGMVKDEVVQITLPANSVQDLDGNYNVLSNTIELVYKVIGGNNSEEPFRTEEKVQEDSLCKVITYQNHLGQEIFLGYKAGRIGEDDFGGANGDLAIKFMGLFRSEEEFQTAPGGIFTSLDFYNFPTKKIKKRFVINDFMDIETTSKDYDRVVTMNSVYLMQPGRTHSFRPRAALDWETLFKTMLEMKEIEILGKNELVQDDIWLKAYEMVKSGEIITDRFNRTLDNRKYEQATRIILTAHEYDLFEELDDLRTPPTRKNTHGILERIFGLKIKYLKDQDEGTISRIEFARLFVAGYEEYDETMARFNRVARHLKHKFEEEKVPAPGNKRRLGSTYFRNITDIDTVINARSQRAESNGRIYPHTVSLREWEDFQALVDGSGEKDDLSIDYSYGRDGDGISVGSSSGATSLVSAINNEKAGIIFNYGSGEKRVANDVFGGMKGEGVKDVYGHTIVNETTSDWGGYIVTTREFVCPNLATPMEKQELVTIDDEQGGAEVIREKFFNAQNYKVPHRYMVNDFADIATGSPDYMVMVKMNSLQLMRASADHRFRANEVLEWEILFDSLLKLKQVDLQELTLKERAENPLWREIRDLMEAKWAEYKEINPGVLMPERRVINRKADIIYTAYQYGLIENVDELALAPTRKQVHSILEKVFQSEIEYELANEESSMSRIEFARMFVQQHAFIGNKVESVKKALGRLEVN